MYHLYDKWERGTQAIGHICYRGREDLCAALPALPLRSRLAWVPLVSHSHRWSYISRMSWLALIITRRTRDGRPARIADQEGAMRHDDHDYKRNGTTTLFAALETLQGKVVGECHTRQRHQEF